MDETQKISLNGIELTAGQLRYVLYMAMNVRTNNIHLDSVEGCKQAASVGVKYIFDFIAMPAVVPELPEWEEGQEQPVSKSAELEKTYYSLYRLESLRDIIEDIQYEKSYSYESEYSYTYDKFRNIKYKYKKLKNGYYNGT